ncbi:Phenazine biosynthesis-like domain-containing protein [Pseudolycoriella hygida]|uniref:Phenazine biosynthesis-like domain-containing protein n=1 Tax=Pseudolycoriella hygida TaxID=35572 RepID=A0A9Q0MZP9_9DIPT|nr:Phenazine biosynthesis-like domain-containing protein [Pseudolycoriella hygida]
MSSFPFAIVDAFCIPNESFTGNQAAVCVLPSDDSLTDEIKQKIAAELNLSETAFVSKSWHKSDSTSNDRQFTLRWLTPETEVPLCGHATLATARVLFETLQCEKETETQTTIEFDTKFKGKLAATMDWSTNRISLDFPLAPAIPFSVSELGCLPQLLTELLGPTSTNEIHSIHYSPLTKKLLVRLQGEASESNVNDSTLLKLKPRLSGLVNIKGNDLILGIIATMKGSDEVNFYSRYFAPWVGIDEDPVTGSAHTVLAAYWSDEYKRNEILGKQCSKRSGLVWCKLQEPGRVRLEGLSNFVVRGDLTL